jgi:hypothetical protein
MEVERKNPERVMATLIENGLDPIENGIFGWLDPVDEPLGNGAVVCLTAGQYDGDETALASASA